VPRTLLSAFVTGARQVLAAQLFVSVAAVGLAGWTFSVTNELIRERGRLRERVIQLEGELGARGIVVPPTVVVDEPPTRTAYPGEVGLAKTAAEQTQEFDPRQLLSHVFAPAPPMRAVVLHVRNERDAQAARRLGEELSRTGNVRVLVNVMSARDPRPTGYAYYDGRQSRAAASIVARFNDIAREREVAAWSAQLRGVALPAAGEYTADRTDIVLPQLPDISLQLRQLDPDPLSPPEAPPETPAPPPTR